MNSARNQRVCPHCDTNWWDFSGMDHIETMRPLEWHKERDITGKGIFIVEIECPKCFEWFWFHVGIDYLEMLVDLTNARKDTGETQ